MNKKIRMRIQIAIISIVAIFVIAGIALSFIVESALNNYASEIVGVNVSVDNVSINTIAGTVDIDGLIIGNPEGFKSENAISIGEMSVSLSLLSLLSDTIKINNIFIYSPQISYEIGLGGTNISKIQQNLAGDKQPKQQESAQSQDSGKKIIIEKLVIKQAKLRAGAIGAVVTIPLPNIQINDIGKQNDGASFATALGQVFGAISKEITNADLSPLKDGLKDLGGKLENIGSKLKGLF